MEFHVLCLIYAVLPQAFFSLFIAQVFYMFLTSDFNCPICLAYIHFATLPCPSANLTTTNLL
jgi:hypothetical protein